MRIYFVSRGTEEWVLMWARLQAYDARLRGSQNRLEGSCESEHEQTGECWQYMGSVEKGDAIWAHQFRHRYHPVLLAREYVELPASPGWLPPTVVRLVE